MTRIDGKTKMAAVGLMVASALAMPLAASAHGHGWGRGGGYYGGYHGGDHDYRGGYYGGYRHHEGHWEGGRWIAGALVAGAVVGLVDAAVNPRPVYYDAPVVYSRPRTVIYEDRPVIERRVVRTRTVVYDDSYPTRYVGDDDDD